MNAATKASAALLEASDYPLSRRLAAEGLGTALLLMMVVGSGIMGQRLAAGNTAVALLANALATGAGLTVLIALFGPVSGAHFNPAVTLVFMLKRDIGWPSAGAYVLVQVLGAVLGVWTAHLMFGEPVLQVSTKLRDGVGQALSEFVATAGLLLTVIGVSRFRPTFTPAAVGLYITSAYWFTASTSFANPAVTLARCLTDSFSGIAPASAPAFMVAQLSGAVAAGWLSTWLWRDRN